MQIILAAISSGDMHAAGNMSCTNRYLASPPVIGAGRIEFETSGLVVLDYLCIDGSFCAVENGKCIDGRNGGMVVFLFCSNYVKYSCSPNYTCKQKSVTRFFVYPT